MNYITRAGWIEFRHWHWCAVLEKFTREHAPKVKTRRPDCSIVCRRSRASGRYRPFDGCRYYLQYAMIEGDEYDETIAHEVAHHYQDYFKVLDDGSLRHCEPHGELFFFLLRYVCGFPAARRFHTVTRKRANTICEMLRTAGCPVTLPVSGVPILLPQDMSGHAMASKGGNGS